MILRAAAVLALALGLTALAAFLTLVGKAPWSPPGMRHLREMKERIAAPPGVTPFTIADFEALPHGAPFAAYAPLESRGVSLEGYVQRILRAVDGDTHFEVAVTPRAPGGPDTAYVTAEVTPQWWRRSDRWSYEGLATALRPNRGGATPWPGGPARVRVTGWLLYDFQHDEVPTQWALVHGGRVSGWEIHPVTRLELWDEARAAWADLPR